MRTDVLITPEALAERIEARDCVVFDCRFDLADPSAGREAWRRGRVPGAVYAHLDDDLSSPVGPATGRHPLPGVSEFAGFLARAGWRRGHLAVAYDDQGGAIAARLWWLMRFFGAGPSALLDGGLRAWVDQGRPLESGASAAEPVVSEPPDLAPNPDLALEARTVERGLEDGTLTLLDARAAARYRGEVEPLDTVAGHVPGALNRPFDTNLDANGRFRSRDALRAEFAALLGTRAPETLAHMCGSGVTACHNLLAMEWAGLSGSKLYVGSWSGWIRDPERPVATGEG